MRIVILFAILLVSACTSEYDAHFSREYQDNSWHVSHHHEEVLWVLEGEWYAMPDSREESLWVDMIDAAQERLWIMLYIWTELPDIVEAIRRANDRDVDIRVHMERTPYAMPWVNNPMIRHLTDMNIPLTFSDTERYAFMHAKVWIRDTTACISTGNWTRSFFVKNREFVFCTDDVRVLDFIERLFVSDAQWWAYIEQDSFPDFMILSPVNTRERLRQFLHRTRESLIVYTQTLDDPEVIWIISQLQDDGIQVTICTAKNTTNTTNREVYSHLDWTEVNKPYLHTKIILRDGGELWFWSQNMTTNSIDRNREVWLLMSLETTTRDWMMQYIDADCLGRSL